MVLVLTGQTAGLMATVLHSRETLGHGAAAGRVALRWTGWRRDGVGTVVGVVEAGACPGARGTTIRGGARARPLTAPHALAAARTLATTTAIASALAAHATPAATTTTAAPQADPAHHPPRAGATTTSHRAEAPAVDMTTTTRRGTRAPLVRLARHGAPHGGTGVTTTTSRHAAHLEPRAATTGMTSQRSGALWARQWAPRVVV